MNATDITAFAGLGVSILTLIVMPVWLRNRTHKNALDRTAVVSWEGITTRLEKERDRLQERLDAKDAAHEAEIRRLTEQWQKKLDACTAKIVQQQAEIDNLYRRLGQEK